MAEQIKHLYEFGPFRIDPPERLLVRQGHSVPVTPKAFDILVTLIQRNGHLVEKSQLMEAVWGDSFVEEGNLAVAISVLRKALGDDIGKDRKYIQTVAKRGYRFVGDVREVVEQETQLPVPVTTVSTVAPAATVSTLTPMTVASNVAPIAHPPRRGRVFLTQRVMVAVLVAAVALGVVLRLTGSQRSHSTQVASGSPERVFATEHKMMEAADPSMSVLLSSRAKMRLKLSGAKNSEADQLYLRGLYFWNKRTVAGLRRGIEYFEQATIKDPHDALGYAGLADAYVLLNSYGVEPSREAYPSAKAAALKSLQLDDLLPEAHASLGMILFFYEWKWPEAEQELRRAIDLDPNYAMAHSWYALDLLAMGRSAEALNQAQLAQNLDPLLLIVNTEVGWAYYSSRQYFPAIDAFQNVIDLDQHFARAHTRLGMVYAAERDFGAAIREFKKAQELSGPDAYVDGLLGYAQALSGNKSAARKLFKELSERSHREYVPAFSMALICIGLGDKDSALDWLNKSFQERSTYLVYAKTDPLLDSVRSDPRFGILMDRMGLDGGKRDSGRHI
jgi:DNA-binding winged helix-turn-helix (wHTH) protein